MRTYVFNELDLKIERFGERVGERALRSYISVLGTLALSLAASWVYWYGIETSMPLVAGALCFSVVFVLMDAFPIRVGDSWEISPLDIALVLSIVLLGPFWTMLAAVPCALRVGGRDTLRSAYETSRNTAEIFIAGIVFSLVSGPLLLAGLSGSSTEIASTVYATGLAAVSLLAVNNVLHAGLLKIKYDQSFSESCRESVRPYLFSHVASVATSAVAVLALLHYGPVAALVSVAGAVGGQALVYSARESRRRIARLEEENRSLRASLEGVGRSFGSVILTHLGSKDGYTHKHSSAVAVYARCIAIEMKLDEKRAARVETAGLLHNIGMLDLPDGLLGTMGKLNSVAREKLEAHPERAQEMLGALPGLEDIGSWIRWHHERPDGRGYPDRLRASWIPLESKILHVSQAYSAMILDQPRRPGMPFEEARGQLIEGIGTQFDEQVVRAFLRVLDTEAEGYRMADDHRFSPERFTPENSGSPGNPAANDSASEGS